MTLGVAVLKTFIFLAAVAWVLAAHAQVRVLPEGRAPVNQLFDTPARDSLECKLRKGQARLDFLLRYSTFYVIACRLSQFDPKEPLVSYVRVTPRGADPVLLGEIFDVPTIPPEATQKLGTKQLRKLRIEMSGAFAVGQGKYKVELLLLDKDHRSYRKTWNLSTPGAKEQVAYALPPLAVEPLEGAPWDGKLAGKGHGIHLTVLLHAASMDPASAKLYAWDRAFLLQSLATLLRQTPCESVKIVAFNLDQQREIFRDGDLDSAGFRKLAQSLRDLELGTISVKALQRQTWPELLVRLARDETTTANRPDAVVFLGPASHFQDKVPQEAIHSIESGGPDFFYFEYFPVFMRGGEFGDSIHNLTSSLHGTVFRIHTAVELGQAIHKMLEQVRRTERAQEGGAQDSMAD